MRAHEGDRFFFLQRRCETYTSVVCDLFAEKLLALNLAIKENSFNILYNPTYFIIKVVC